MGIGRVNSPHLTSFPTRAVAVSPDDGIVFTDPSTIFVGVGGTVRVMPWNGDATVDYEMPTGTVVPVLVKAVYNTGTDATDMVRSY